MPMPFVSVIIPTFNRAHFLKRALDSVTRQTFMDWEIVVVDDASNDDTETVFDRFREETKVPARRIRLEQNSGVSHARNTGVAHSSGAWLAFLDSDDEWLPPKLEQQLRLQQFNLIHTEEIWLRNGVRVNQMKKHAKSGGQVFRRCVDLTCISASTTILKRELFDQMGGFDREFPICEDYDLWLKVSAKEEVGFVPEPLIRKYGGHLDQLSTSRPAMDFYRIKALVPFLESVLPESEKNYVAENIVLRAQVLLRGYGKYQNLKDQPQVEAWLARARKTLTHTQSAHSAADLRPRSLTTEVL